MIVRPPGGLLREAVRILPDTLRLICGLAADPTLPRAVRIRLAPLRSESFVPSLLSVRPGSFFSFRAGGRLLCPKGWCRHRRAADPLASGSATAIAPPGHPSAGPPRPRKSAAKRKVQPYRHLLISQPTDRSSAVMRQEMRHRDLGLRGGGVTHRGLCRLSRTETLHVRRDPKPARGLTRSGFRSLVPTRAAIRDVC
jgi:hypothetical protein